MQCGHHCGIARGFTPERVLLRGKTRQRMKEKEPLRRSRDATEEHIAPFEVHKFMTEDHTLMIPRHLRKAVGRNENDRPDDAGNEWRVDLRRVPQLRA